MTTSQNNKNTIAATEHQIPYQIDESLVQEAQTIGSGIHVHDVNQALGEYGNWICLWNKSFDMKYWYSIVASERKLRGIIAEAKLGKNYHAPWNKQA